MTDAIYGAGFNSNGRFYAKANEQLGMTPTAFRAGGDGATIRFAVGECSLGSVLVAASEKGICAIFLGDDPDELARELQNRFPKANIVGAEKTFDQLVSHVVGLVEQPARGLDLPLDVRGTAFQVRVWTALRQIPPGSTASYTEIARRIGMRTGRARRRAGLRREPHRHRNPLPSRRKDGRIALGYRWGVGAKPNY